MVSAINNASINYQKIKDKIDQISMPQNADEGLSTKSSGAKTEFLDLLEKGLAEVNTSSRNADKASMDLASGKTSNIHETMLAITKAELGFNMMVQMRNKVIEAYQEVMRMQV